MELPQNSLTAGARPRPQGLRPEIKRVIEALAAAAVRRENRQAARDLVACEGQPIDRDQQ